MSAKTRGDRVWLAIWSVAIISAALTLAWAGTLVANGVRASESAIDSASEEWALTGWVLLTGGALAVLSVILAIVAGLVRNPHRTFWAVGLATSSILVAVLCFGIPWMIGLL